MDGYAFCPATVLWYLHSQDLLESIRSKYSDLCSAYVIVTTKWAVNTFKCYLLWLFSFIKISLLGTCIYLKWPRTQSTYFSGLQCRYRRKSCRVWERLMLIGLCAGSTEAGGYNLPGIFPWEAPPFGVGRGSQVFSNVEQLSTST